MTELVMFNSHGQFVYPNADAIAALSPQERERFSAIEAAYEASDAAAKELAAMEAKVQQDVAEISDIEQHLLRSFKPVTFMDLHRQTVSAKHPSK